MYNRYPTQIETTISVEASVDISEFCMNLNEPTALRIIALIDDDQCDGDFTKDAIKLLVDALIDAEDPSVIDLLKDLRKEAKRKLK